MYLLSMCKNTYCKYNIFTEFNDAIEHVKDKYPNLTTVVQWADKDCEKKEWINIWSISSKNIDDGYANIFKLKEGSTLRYPPYDPYDPLDSKN